MLSKNWNLTRGLLLVALASCGGSFSTSATAASEGVDATAEAKTYHFGNKLCPVMGEAVNPDEFVEYKDEEHALYGRIYMCCVGCEKKIEKELPQLYKTFYRRDPRTGKETAPIELKNAECPLSGKAVVAEATLEYNGFRIALCCKDCVEGFLIDPDEKLKELVPKLEDYEYEP